MSARGQRRAFTNPAVTNNTYAGELALPFLTPAVKSGDTIAKGYVRTMDGIRYKAPMVSSTINGDILQAADCAFQDGDSVVVDERVLTLVDLKVNESLCRATMLPTWVGQVGARASTDWASPEFRQFVLGTIAGKVGEAVENAIWKGSSLYSGGFLSNTGTFDRAGLAAGILGGSTEAAIVAITSANAIAQFGKVYDSATANVPGILSKNDLGFYCSHKTYSLYIQQLAGLGAHSTSLAGQGMGNMGSNQNFEGVSYLGLPIRVCPGMFDDAIVLASADNLAVGSNLMTDFTEVKYIPAYEYDGSDNVKVVMQFGLGCQVGVLSDVVVGALAAVLPA